MIANSIRELTSNQDWLRVNIEFLQNSKLFSYSDHCDVHCFVFSEYSIARDVRVVAFEIAKGRRDSCRDEIGLTGKQQFGVEEKIAFCLLAVAESTKMSP